MDVITGESLSGLVRVQPVEFLCEWPKVQGFKSVTTLGESEKRPCDGESTDFRMRPSSSMVPVFTSSKLDAVNLQVCNRTGLVHCVYFG
jgi:hypothetical protein